MNPTSWKFKRERLVYWAVGIDVKPVNAAKKMLLRPLPAVNVAVTENRQLTTDNCL
jgi:hypothetical protein